MQSLRSELGEFKYMMVRKQSKESQSLATSEQRLGVVWMFRSEQKVTPSLV